MAEKLNIGTAIAYRTLELAGNPEEKVNIFIGKPEKLHEEEWICPYRIVGAGKDINFQIHALDGIQTLQLIWKVIDGTLAGANLALCWPGGDPFAGFAEEY
ncbi:hypothetical protein [Neisseria sp. 74A18]|uniref:DUF6968 family protein n=1 Tax=Neisseria sp. 74A18 TaxID=1696094 RepID=UPI0006CAEBEE|nr:hypothetical protein [Neisseria sp. 74A18]KPN74761.1 hypothetical protein AKG43_01660 [Neisseria sp. 74A18]